MAAKLPDQTALGGTPSLRGDRPIATPNTTAIGAGLQSLGGDIYRTGAFIQDGWNKQEEANAWSSYLAFKAQEDLGWKNASDNLKPEEARGFAASYTGIDPATGKASGQGYGARAKAFQNTLPQRLQQVYGDRLGADVLARVQQAQGIEKTEQIRQANATLDTTIDQHLMPRVEAAATKPGDDPTKFPALQQIIAEGDQAIDSNPALSPIEKATAKQKWHEKAQTGFANALPSREKGTLDPNSAGTELGDTPIWGKVLDAVPYAAKLAITHDGYVAYLAEETARRNAAVAADKARYNAYENAVRDNKFGLADVQSAYNSGQLNDADERGKLIGLITERDKEGLNLSAASAKVNGGYQFNPYSANDTKAVDLWYDKGVGKGGAGLLQPPPSAMPDIVGGAEGAVGHPVAGNELPLDPKSVLMWTVGRTKYAPKSAADTIQGGIYSPDAVQRDAAFTVMDALARSYPSAYRQAFSLEDRKRLDIYQALAATVPPDVLAQALAPVDPKTQAERDTLATKGREDAAKNYNADSIINGAFGGYGQGVLGLGWGRPNTPTDPGVVAAITKDFDEAYGQAYAMVRNSGAAEKLAFKWIGNKWGPTDIGSGDNTVMAYPPERYYPALNGNHHWMDEQLQASVQQAYPKAQSWGIVEAPQTETEATAGVTPGYFVWYTDETGGFRTATDQNGVPLVMRFNYDAARQTVIANFAAKNQAAQDRNLPSWNPQVLQLQRAHGADFAPNVTASPQTPAEVNAGVNALEQAHQGGGGLPADNPLTGSGATIDDARKLAEKTIEQQHPEWTPEKKKAAVDDYLQTIGKYLPDTTGKAK